MASDTAWACLEQAQDILRSEVRTNIVLYLLFISPNIQSVQGLGPEPSLAVCRITNWTNLTVRANVTIYEVLLRLRAVNYAAQCNCCH